MYQTYYDLDRGKHTPPIPTAIVPLPLTQHRLQQLCYSKIAPSEEERVAVLARVLQAAQDLEALVPVNDDMRRVVEGFDPAEVSLLSCPGTFACRHIGTHQ